MTKLQRGPRGDTRGQVILGLLGLSQLGTAIWHAAQPAKNVRAPTFPLMLNGAGTHPGHTQSSGNVSSKEKAAITAQFFGCLSPVPMVTLFRCYRLLTRAPPDLQASPDDHAAGGEPSNAGGSRHRHACHRHWCVYRLREPSVGY